MVPSIFTFYRRCENSKCQLETVCPQFVLFCLPWHWSHGCQQAPIRPWEMIDSGSILVAKGNCKCWTMLCFPHTAASSSYCRSLWQPHPHHLPPVALVFWNGTVWSPILSAYSVNTNLIVPLWRSAFCSTVFNSQRLSFFKLYCTQQCAIGTAQSTWLVV